ncbi:SPE_1075/MLC_0560 family membrane protein [Spiroplasma culicicola]|uniref:Transmembrane protein n=1 Tax=Spiroplasma culicicola AES-1 TaxID=1276246 RepID=W6A5X0_9MOLU|nr:hypothetical protein [Spiroplasma culicicola]AHI52387.1 hypothetical protein SCULI_v1c00460 [Spiroplasma culicicola AES-1]
MKSWFKEQTGYIKKDWRVLLVKASLLIAGMFIMALGIRLYIPTGIGKSQVDFTIFTLIGLKLGNGDVTSAAAYDSYSGMLLYFYLVIALISASMSLVNSIKKYREAKDKGIWVNFSFKIMADIFVSLMLPLIVLMFQKIINEDSIVNLIKSDSTSTDVNPGKASWFFALAFLIYALGIALWVKSGWILGPYNSICQEFITLTKIQYGTGRIIMDLLMAAPGLILFWIIPSGDVSTMDFLFTNFSIATMVFLFCTGPLVAQIIKILNKAVDYEKLKVISTN